MTSLYKIVDNKLQIASPSRLSQEKLIQEWVAANPALIGHDLVILGREVRTEHGGFIDILGLDIGGNLVVIELKRDRTPRDVVGQVLDYGSWVNTLSTRDVYDVMAKYRQQDLAEVFRKQFDSPIPEQLNKDHILMIIASELDSESRRIVEYLSQVHGVAINTVFFSVFEKNGEQWLTTDFLMDQEAVAERFERKTRAPWSGYFFANVGDGPDRSWEDMRKYGFLGAGHGRAYSDQLDRLTANAKVFAYQKGMGYVGYGVVKGPKQPASEFVTASGPLFGQPLVQPGIKDNSEIQDMAEYVVSVDWKRTFSLADARTFRGIFANQNIVCKLRDQPTIEFLEGHFGVND